MTPEEEKVQQRLDQIYADANRERDRMMSFLRRRRERRRQKQEQEPYPPDTFLVPPRSRRPIRDRLARFGLEKIASLSGINLTLLGAGIVVILFIVYLFGGFN